MNHLSSEAIDAALSSARHCVTYPYLNDPSHPQGPDPAFPFPDGGYWGEFEQRLLGRYEHVRADPDPDDGASSGSDEDGQATLSEVLRS